MDTPSTGSPGWIVTDLDLYTTTVVYASTNEVATYSNSSLAAYRVINAARSKRAAVNIPLKYPIDTSYKKLQVYKGAVEEFIKSRPREWGTLLSFRATLVEVDLGYIQYNLCSEHRESWQQAGVIGQSKAELTSFCIELANQMNMRYQSPPMPINLNMTSGAGEASKPPAIDMLPVRAVPSLPGVHQREGESVDWKAVASAMFET